MCYTHHYMRYYDWISLQWRHNGRDSVSNHQPRDCLLNSLFGADQRKCQSSASLAFVRGIHRGPVNYPHKEQVMRKMFPFDDVIIFVMISCDNLFKHHIVIFFSGNRHLPMMSACIWFSAKSLPEETLMFIYTKLFERFLLLRKIKLLFEM